MSTPYKNYKHPKVAVFIGYGLLVFSVLFAVGLICSVLGSKLVLRELKKNSSYVADVEKLQQDMREAELNEINHKVPVAIIKRCVLTGELAEADKARLSKSKAEEVVRRLKTAKQKAQTKKEISDFKYYYVLAVFSILTFGLFMGTLLFGYGGRKLTAKVKGD